MPPKSFQELKQALLNSPVRALLLEPISGGSKADSPAISGFSGDNGQAAIYGWHGQQGPAFFAESRNGVAIHALSSVMAAQLDGKLHVNGLTELHGSMTVSGDITVAGNIALTGATSDITLQNEDCAEQFDVSRGEDYQAGMVMVLDDEGRLKPSRSPYDKRVAGVVSGAGKFRPAMTLGVTDSTEKRASIALLGKVYCWADAGPKPIEVGDLLTEGHAMAVSDPYLAFGTTIGKALQRLPAGRGMIPILVALQ